MHFVDLETTKLIYMYRPVYILTVLLFNSPDNVSQDDQENERAHAIRLLPLKLVVSSRVRRKESLIL